MQDYKPIITSASICILALLTTVGLQYLQTNFNGYNIPVEIQNGLLLTPLLLGGIINQRYIGKLLELEKTSELFTISVTLILSVLSVLILAILNLSLKLSSNAIAVAGGSGFLLPFTIFLSWRKFTSIPEKQYKLWYKHDNLIDDRAFVFLASVPIKIKLAPSSLNSSYETFEAIMPAQMPLGKMFHYFLVQQQNNNIEIETKDQFKNLIGWRFYIERIKGVKKIPLDPDLNLWENQVKPNDILLAKRVLSLPKSNPLKKTSVQYHEQYQY